MLLLLLLVATASARVQSCTSRQSHYSDTKSYLKPDGESYQPELVARPVWFQRMSLEKRVDMDERIQELLDSEGHATGTGCCMKTIRSGPSAGFMRVHCKRPGSSPRPPRPTRPVVEEDDEPEEPAAPLVNEGAGWPRECRGRSNGLTLNKIRGLLGAGGGAELVAVSEVGRFVARSRTCNVITGCTPWKTARHPPHTNLVNFEDRLNTFTDAQLFVSVEDNKVKLTVRAPYARGNSKYCWVKHTYEPGTRELSYDEIRTGYLDANGGYGCKTYGLEKHNSGNTLKVPFKGTVSNSCITLFSEVYKYPSQTGEMEIQLSWSAKIA